MTTSTSNLRPSADAPPATEALAPPPAPPAAPGPAVAELPRTVWSRFIILLLCLAVVTTTLAFGTVHAWALGIFQLSAGLVVLLWVLDAWRTGTLRVSRNPLPLPLVGLMAVGVVQLWAALTHDQHATRYALVQLSALVVYFAAALTFVDSPRRLRVVVRTVVIFGFLLALYGLMQHFVNPATIFFVREPKQAAPFGPYINRHHFAGYMELTLALPLGLILAGAVERERVILYAFASAIMAIALVMTNSRGGMLSLLAEVFFLALVAASVRRRGRGEEPAAAAGPGGRVRALAARLGLGFAMVLAVLVGVLYFGGEEAVSRMLGTVNSEDPTTGRAHFWQATWQMIQDRPVLGAGLGAFSAVYPQYDTSNGLYRLEQAHNDYLQILSDAGVVGFALGLVFVAALLRMAVARMQSHDKFRRGVALGALAGCAGVLVHSFFDFTLHTPANALLFLLLAALATINGRVEEPEQRRQRRRRRRRSESPEREQIAA